jgi:hypothetical protein
MQGISEIKDLFFDKMNKIDKPSVKLMKRKREETQINKIRDEKGIVQHASEFYRVIREYLKKNLYSNKPEKS